MSRIALMSADLANRIAAGEVIDRPSSVVKELVENSIDAGSRQIRVSVAKAGREQIRVQDDGCGMDRVDAELCFLRHASSKVKSNYDLRRITTLGFRGEALPSIASIAEVELLTYDGSAGPGSRVIVTPGREPEVQDGPQRRGTVFTVSNLFYNTPARLKYLKSDATETSSIVEVVEHLALGFPAVSFELETDGRQVFKTSGRGSIQQAIKEIYGLETAKNMIEISGSNDFFELAGFIARPSISYANRYHQLTFINNRSVYVNKVNQAVIAAYKDYLSPNRYPFTVLLLTVDYSLVDINVHPSKREVRISEEEALARLVKETLGAALRSDRPDYFAGSLPEPKNPAVYLAPPAPTAREIVFEDSRQPAKLEAEPEPLCEEPEPAEPPAPASELASEPHTVLPYLNPLGQVLKTYIVCDGDDGFYLIDQHAAAERINYEKTVRLFEADEVATIAPLVPLVIELPASLVLRLDEAHRVALRRVGIDASPFGATSVKIDALPVVLKDEADSSVVSDLIQSVLKDEAVAISELKHLAIATVACKASIKANMFLTVEGMKVLIKELNQCRNPANCPHGRPTVIKISRYEVEKLFKRTGF